MTGGSLPAVGRRALGAGALTVGAAWALGACTGADDPGNPDRSQDPDTALAAEVMATLDGLLTLHAAVVAEHPRLTRRLSAVTAAHEDHRAAIVEAVVTGSADVTPAPGAGATTSSVTPAPPRPRAALATVAGAEAAAAETLSRLAFRALSGPFVRVIAGMAASAHQHSLALATLAGEEGAP
ncbi:hypothetical protein [Nocardioides massiliensis]|uniref:DUF4439 domain-containing protein n=1 Tax=Nocardioides massiliensis TaxID=1325935 RepID=A0ABT9NQG9_9ACTN|nr:hypothetical protein [Nocardioides massiliensis]MDP9822618.1 hypothetical protein [Nocardioides massiliensis]